MQIKRKTVSMLALALTLTVAGVSCSREDVSRTAISQSKLKPGEVSVSVNMGAITLPVEGQDGQARALSMRMNNGMHNGKASYSIVKMDRDQAYDVISSIGVFYCPTDPSGQKVYYTDPGQPMNWKLVNANANDTSKPLYYKCEQANVVNVPESLLDGTHDWYFMGVIGAEQAADGTITFNPYNATSGFDFQYNGDRFALEPPMTSGWIKLKSRGVGSGTHFTPENWVYSEEGEKPEETLIKFKPRGTLFRILVTNKAGYNLKITDLNLRSNVLSFTANITPESIRNLNVPTSGQTMPLKRGTERDVLLQVRNNSVGKAQTEVDNPGAILAWGLIDNDLFQEINTKHKADNSQSMPYFSVRASATPTDEDVWTSADKQADFFPLEKRASVVSGKPVFLAKVDNLSKMYRDGGQQWLSVIITNNLLNLEKMNFEPIASSGNGTEFKASHPFLNRHSDESLYWLDQVAYSDYDQTLKWIGEKLGTTANFRSNTRDLDITKHPKYKSQLSSMTNDVKYHLPYKEEILEFLPMPKGEHGSYSDLVEITNTDSYREIKTDVVEPAYNLKHSEAANKIHTAVHHLRLGSAEEANMNFMRDLKTKQTLTTDRTGQPGDAFREDMSQFNLFNYFWHKRVVYSLAYLHEGDPESLVAFRYAWVSSPNNSAGLLDDGGLPGGFWNNGNAEQVLSPEFIAKAKAASRPYSEDILKVIRDVSTWSPGRPAAGGVGRAMVSAFVIAMKPIGSFHERVRNLNDLDAIAQESFWTENPKSLVYRIFPAVGFSTKNSTNSNDAVNRNRGAYLMTRNVPAGGVEGKDFYYFYVGPEGWGLFNTKDSDKLNEEYRQTKKNTTFKGYKTEAKQQAQFKGSWTDGVFDSGQYYISRAFPKTGSGIPARFMVGKTLGVPTR